MALTDKLNTMCCKNIFWTKVSLKILLDKIQNKVREDVNMKIQVETKKDQKMHM